MADLYQVTAGNTALAADLNQYYQALKNGGNSTTAASGFANLLNVGGTVTAAANNDALYGLNVSYTGAPITLATAGKTGLTAYLLGIAGNVATKTGGGTIDNCYSLLVNASTTIGTYNWAAWFQGHLKTGQAGSAPTHGSDATNCTITLLTGSNDTAGTIQIVTSAGIATGTALTTLTFGSTYANAPRVLITPSSSAAGNVSAYGIAATTSGFTLYVMGTGLSSGGTFTVDYLVIGW